MHDTYFMERNIHKIHKALFFWHYLRYFYSMQYINNEIGANKNNYASQYKFSDDKTLLFVLLFLAAVTSIRAVLFPQLSGEDESLTFLVAKNILESIYELDWKKFIFVIGTDWHPPGRNLLPVPFIALFGDNITAIRIPYWLMWISTCFLLSDIAGRLGGRGAAFICGILIVGTGLFNLEIQGLAHGAATFFGILIIREIILHPPDDLSYAKNKTAFLRGGVWAFLGFLFFTSLLPMAGLFHLLWLYPCFKFGNKMQKFKIFLILNIPFFIFYIGYYLIFIGIPIWLIEFNGISILKSIMPGFIPENWELQPIGQYHQYLTRINGTELNISSLKANLATITWAFAPFLGPIIVILGMIGQILYAPRILILTLPYFLIFSFYITGNTGQHFQSWFIWILPFASQIILGTLKKSEKIGYFIGLPLLVTLFSFTWFAHLQQYNEINFPHAFAKKIGGITKWPQNLQRPLKLIVKDLEEIAGSSLPVSREIDGAIELYHGKNLNWVTPPYIEIKDYKNEKEVIKCRTLPRNKIKALVANKSSIKFCPDTNVEYIQYSGSNLVVIIFPNYKLDFK